MAAALADINYVDLARKQLQRRYLEPAQTVIEHDYADYPGLQADLLLALSASARNLGALDTADAAIQKGEQMAARMTTGRDAMAARIRHEQGLILLARARYAQAEPLLEDAVQTLLRVQSGTDASTLDAMESLVQLRLHRRNPEALPLARQLIGWRHQNTDTPVVRTLQDQRLLGESQVIAGNLPEARQLLESAHAELRRQVPDAVLVRSQIEVALSDLNARDGQRAESAAFSRQALEGFRQALGERHETTLQQMLAVAQDLRRNGELDAAENLGDQIATLVHEVYGSKHPLITEIQHLRGILLYRRGLTLEALDLLQQTREQLRREATGNDYSNPWTVAAIMPDILIDLGRLDEAEALIEELLAQSEGSPVWGLGAISVRQAQARLLRQQGRLPEAVSVLRETLAFAQQREPGNHSILLDLSSQLGGLLHAEGKFQEAERYLLNSLAGQNALEFDRRVRAPLTRARLGALRLSQGNGEEALQLSRQGLSGARLFMHEGDTRWAELWILNARAEIAMGDKEAGKHALSQGLRVARDSQLGRYYHTLLDALCAELWGQGNRGQSDAC